jgi:hypothetical protein
MPLLWYIALDNNNCSGPLPPAPPGTAARLVTLSRNNFAGPLPPSWRHMRGIVHIDLRSNNLDGPIPPEWAEMEWVNLGKTNLTVDGYVREGFKAPTSSPTPSGV